MKTESNNHRGLSNPAAAPAISVRPSWAKAAVACILALAFLALLLWPGIFLYPGMGQTSTEEALVTLQQDANRTLEERIETLQATLDSNACRLEDTLMQRNPEGRLQPLASSGERPILPLPPERVRITPSQDGEATQSNEHGLEGGTSTALVGPSGQEPIRGSNNNPQTLAALLDSSTVLVLQVNGQKISLGTGFFINPSLIITNLHVVGETPTPKIYVTSKALGQVTLAEVIARSPRIEIGQPDFALLRVPAALQVRSLSITRSAERLQNVVAAGFPYLVVQTDEAFQRLLSGDASAVPELALTQGIVTARQSSSGTDVILHSAAISQGNSGGPLVDQCGHLLGINTFIRSQQEDEARMNYALGTDSLLAFLTSSGVEPTLAEGRCEPTLATSSGAGR